MQLCNSPKIWFSVAIFLAPLPLALGQNASIGDGSMLDRLMQPPVSAGYSTGTEQFPVQSADSAAPIVPPNLASSSRNGVVPAASHTASNLAIHSNSPMAISPASPSNDLASKHRESFLERAKQSEKGDAPFSEQLNKIGLNLIIVLVIAAGASLLLKQFQKDKTEGSNTGDRAKRFKILGEAKIDRTTSLTLVQFQGHQVLLARDANGTKSMQVIAPTFSESLSEVEDEPQVRLAPGSLIEQEDSSEIDEQLLKLFINKSRKAA